MVAPYTGAGISAGIRPPPPLNLLSPCTAGVVDVCLIPEVNFDLEKLCNFVKSILERKNYCVLCVAEGEGLGLGWGRLGVVGGTLRLAGCVGWARRGGGLCTLVWQGGGGSRWWVGWRGVALRGGLALGLGAEGQQLPIQMPSAGSGAAHFLTFHPT